MSSVNIVYTIMSLVSLMHLKIDVLQPDLLNQLWHCAIFCRSVELMIVLFIQIDPLCLDRGNDGQCCSKASELDSVCVCGGHQHPDRNNDISAGFRASEKDIRNNNTRHDSGADIVQLLFARRRMEISFQTEVRYRLCNHVCNCTVSCVK